MLYGEKKITAKKAIEIRNYVDGKMALWEPDPNLTPELQIRKIEELINDGFTIEFKDTFKQDKKFLRMISGLMTKDEKQSDQTKQGGYQGSFFNNSSVLSKEKSTQQSGLVLPSVYSKANNVSGFNTSMSKDYPMNSPYV